MKSKKELLDDVLRLARENIPPAPMQLDISLKKVEELANTYNADVNLCLIGVCLMDVKLSEAQKLGKQKEHVKMSADFAREFLKDYDITTEEYDKLINCVEAHHGKVPFTCIEAEICANADCYRFIHPTGVYTFMSVLSKRYDNLKEQVENLKYKLEEKHNILSLDKAKEELEYYYEEFSNQFDEILKYLDK